ncbi:nucleoside diphosphate kinase homolog 5-like [Agrilus planipennis]|uniref:Nucleoside diphosphate kinase homolog 5-like n=1 Tax=Agrilus planipennis TaxID=224129 RepID=A0A1W4WJ31_AGRPL|nr:nucleoside diphosphate kinase homolog 5-like [Agrilus planipennis]
MCDEKGAQRPCCERLLNYNPPLVCDASKDDASVSGIVSRPKSGDETQPCGKQRIRGPCSDSYYSTTTNLTDDEIHYLSPISPVSPLSDDEGIFPIEYKTPTILRLLRELPPARTISSSVSCIEPLLQRTLAIIKPEAMQYKETVLRAIRDAGFTVIRERTIHLTPEQVSEIYNKYYGTPAFPNMVITMSVGPILVLCMAAANAITKWKDMVGPDKILRSEWFVRTSMRARFGLHDDMIEALHASENIFEAERENRYFNPESILEPIITEENQVADFCNLYVNPVLINGLTELLKKKPADPIIWLGNWLLNNDPYQPRFPPEIAVLPT